ncbi:MAG: hypothetical protein V2I54_13285 [Bacteroidales bacterium]|nr:hypothetical protein [Bacteroidales bacterium]
MAVFRQVIPKNAIFSVSPGNRPVFTGTSGQCYAVARVPGQGNSTLWSTLTSKNILYA